jgi:predicted MFS family arabinose efflux permease
MITGALASAALAFPVDEPPPRRSGAAVGSFLVGFTLSWVFGAALYVFLISG